MSNRSDESDHFVVIVEQMFRTARGKREQTDVRGIVRFNAAKSHDLLAFLSADARSLLD